MLTIFADFRPYGDSRIFDHSFGIFLQHVGDFLSFRIASHFLNNPNAQTVF
jgi:hypothetical protein